MSNPIFIDQLVVGTSPVLRTQMAVNTTFFVATTGNDSNDGLTAPTAWLTVGHALSVVASTYDIAAGVVATISIADGTYVIAASLIPSPLTGAGTVLVQGNTTTPANVIIQCNSGSFFLFNCLVGVNRYTFSSFKLVGSGSNNAGFASDGGANIVVKNVSFGTGISGDHLVASNLGIIKNSSTAYTISGGSATHINAQTGGVITFSAACTCTISGTPAFTTFANAVSLGFIQVITGVMTYSGSATGVRYSSVGNSNINTIGGGATFFPGGTSGTTATGGIYL